MKAAMLGCIEGLRSIAKPSPLPKLGVPTGHKRARVRVHVTTTEQSPLTPTLSPQGRGSKK